MASSYDKTYRVRGIPGAFTEDDTRKLLSSAFLVSNSNVEDPKPRVHSLGPDPYSFGQDAFQVATVTFRKILPILQESQDEWTLPISGWRSPNGGPEVSSLTIDSHFRGFTPLNSVEDHSIELDLKGARVLLYGYDTGLVRSESFQNIDDIAVTFSRSIRSIRRTYKVDDDLTPRPIIFIAHSLGGLILKKAILQMKGGVKADRDNFNSIYGALLFGVPNQGIRIEHWLPIVNGQPNEDLIRNLGFGSKYLRDLGDEFHLAFSFPDSEIISIYETERTRVAKEVEPGKWALTGDYEILVPVNSATDSCPAEPVHRVLAVKQNHSNLVKFPSRWDENYKLIVSHLGDFSVAAVKTIQARFFDEQEIEQLGLFELWPASPAGIISKIKTRVDIVAIHGLGGGPFKTWTEGYRMWLRDFLPSTLPEARIMTYGYGSAIAFCDLASGISDTALDLLERLRSKKKKEEKEALVTASERPRYEMILRATTGVVFMGAPHHGVDAEFWANVLDKLANMSLTGSAQMGLLNELPRKSALLSEICSQFVEKTARLQIFSFYERLKTPGLEDLVVDQQSSILHLPNETPLPIESDHAGLCKFLTANSQKYLIVQESLVELVEELVGKEEENSPDLSDLYTRHSEFLRELRDFDHVSILERIPRNRGTTCQWILGYPAFTSWEGPDSPCLLWIYGLAGSGKSVLAGYIIRRLQEINSTGSQGQGERTEQQSLSYFFCDDKDSQRNTATALLRSILSQILPQNAKLFRHVDARFLENSADFIFNSEAILDCLYRIFGKSRGIVFWIVIDALDELQEIDRAEVLDGLRSIIAADLVGRVKVILTDRQGPSAEYESSLALVIQTLNLDIGPVWRDVEISIRSDVQAFCVEHRFPQGLRGAIQSELISRSQGVFLLASLNWANFSDNVTYWSQEVVNRRLLDLRKLSATLESLYCSLLRKIPQDFRPLLRSAFSWILAARESLTMKDLQYAIFIHPCCVSYQEVYCLGLDFAAVLRRFCSRFIRVGEDGYIEFCHQSVKELLTRDISLEGNREILCQYRTSQSEREYKVSIACLTLLRWKEFSCPGVEDKIAPKKTLLLWPDRAFVENKLRDFPLLRYSVRNWYRHCESVRNDRRVVSLISEYILSPNGNYFRLLGGPWMVETRVRRWGVTPELFEYIPPLNALIQYGDFAIVAETLVKLGHDINRLDFEGMTPLHWALIRGRRETFAFLMRRSDLNPNAGREGCDKAIHSCIDQTFKHLHLFKTLLEDKRVDPNSAGRVDATSVRCKGKRALHMVVEHIWAFEAMLDPLLGREDIVLNIKDEKGVTPFIKVLSTGHGKSATLKFLQQPVSSLDITAKDRNGTNALSLASIRGWGDVVRQIALRDQSQIFSADNDGMNSLTRAAYFGQRVMLESLLNGITADRVHRLADLGRYNLLNLCAQQDWEELTNSLTARFGLVSLEQDDKGRTLLHWAVEWGWKYGHANHSREQRARINVQDKDGKTALHIAAECRNFKAARSLLGQGACYTLKDKFGKNPVHEAAESGSRAILELFLSGLDREFGKDNEGRGLLHFVAMWECEAVVQKYIASRHPIIDLRDKTRRTPLHYAAIFGNIDAATVLLRHGASVGPRDFLGCTALHHAFQQGHLDMIKLLLKHGANIRERDGFSRTCLQISISSGRLPIVDFVFEKGANVRNRDKWGKTALHRAAVSANPRIIHELLEYGADINSRDSSGYTPLHVAVMADNRVAVQALLTYKIINPSLEDNLGCTSLDWALARREMGIASDLRASGATSTPDYKKALRLYARPVPKKEEWHDWPLYLMRKSQSNGPRPQSAGPLTPNPTSLYSLSPPEITRP
ncbi:hypothetical protein FGG08_002501 [Glutinoglossum americanum]|uniref:NACHT domain-containing protein n=1 Tax=Glutinoglossum americanum TaxID=1670608 RepID=A0A9P8I659_9PEZI|nr:hypothetical protein FGG08_002501 [Glutinoglossum americanum]